MSRLFYQTMQDNLGNLLFGVSGTMRLAGTGTAATIYGDEALTVVLPNPMTNHPSFGSFKCYLGPGSYDFYMAKAGYTFETLTGVQGGGTMMAQDANNVAITGGAVTGLSALSSGTIYAEDLLQVGNNLLLVDVATRKLAILTALGTFDLDINATVGGMRITGALALGAVPDAAYVLKTGGDAWLQGRLGVKVAPTYDLDINATASGMHVTGPVAFGTVPDAAYALKTGGDAWVQGKLGVKVAPTYDLDINATASGMHVTGPVALGTTPDSAYVLKTGGDAWVQGRLGVKVAPTYDLDINATASGMHVTGPVAFGTTPDAAYVLKTGAGRCYVGGRLEVGAPGIVALNNTQLLWYAKQTNDGLVIEPSDNDTGAGGAVIFRNVGGTNVGSISTNASGTAYNTSSDARLKTAVQALTGALDVVQALRPVKFRWHADNSPGVGFLASAVQQVVDGVVTGEADAVDAAGQIVPQQMDASKLIPWLVGAVQALAARVAHLEDQLGVS